MRATNCSPFVATSPLPLSYFVRAQAPGSGNLIARSADQLHGDEHIRVLLMQLMMMKIDGGNLAVWRRLASSQSLVTCARACSPTHSLLFVCSPVFLLILLLLLLLPNEHEGACRLYSSTSDCVVNTSRGTRGMNASRSVAPTRLGQVAATIFNRTPNVFIALAPPLEGEGHARYQNKTTCRIRPNQRGQY